MADHRAARDHFKGPASLVLEGHSAPAEGPPCIQIPAPVVSSQHFLVSDWLKRVAILAHPIASHQYATSIMRAALVITGASRGFGRCLALDFVRETACQDIDVVRIHAQAIAALPASSADSRRVFDCSAA